MGLLDGLFGGGQPQQPTPYDTMLSQVYTPAMRQQALYRGLLGLGGGLLMAGARTNDPGRSARGYAQGFGALGQALQDGPQQALHQAQIGSQLQTQELARKQAEQRMALQKRIDDYMAGGSPAPGGASAPVGMGGGIPTSGGGMPWAVNAGPFPTPAPGAPVPGTTPLGGGAPGAPQGASSTPGTPATMGRTLGPGELKTLANLYMSLDPGHALQLLKEANAIDPTLKVEMTAAGHMLIKNASGSYISAQGVDRALAGRAGGIAGSEANARNASELRFAGPIARTREQGKTQGGVDLVQIPGGGQMPGAEAITALGERGKISGQLAPQPNPMGPGQLPGNAALRTGEAMAGRVVDVAPGTQSTLVPPVPLGGGEPGAPIVQAQSASPHPNSQAGQSQAAQVQADQVLKTEVQGKAQAATATMRVLDAMAQGRANGFVPNALAPLKGEASAMLQAIGVSQGLADNITGGQSGRFRLAEVQTQELVQSVAKTFGANPSNYEGQQLKKALATTTDPAQAYDAIVAYSQAQAQRAIARNTAMVEAERRGVAPSQFIAQEMQGEMNARPQGGVTYPTPTQEAINHLRMNPRLAKEFDAMYGPGSARLAKERER